MTFIDFYSDINFTISSNFKEEGFDVFAYKNNRSYFKIVFKDVSSADTILFNGYYYKGYKDNEEVIIEVSDIVRANDSHTFNFYDIDNILIANFTPTILGGFSTNQITGIYLPQIIKLNLGYYPTFKICSSFEFAYSTGGVFFNITKEYSIDSLSTQVAQNEKKIAIIEIDTCNSLLFEWASINGYKKNWYFATDKLNFLSDKSVSIETGDSDYKQYKNKKISFSVIERMADLGTQKYLSDLVISDDVKVYIDGEWMSVSIDTNNVEVSHKRKDLIFNVNFKHYDTI